eukprot:TRINITY_DN11346_c1_g2_i1.p2 TRINITY_DN11346_c1_g2~~TRINITY_DN11346_c1_g2_i1.p2  ORF type:complete len:166 (+),score=52.67 TRINITY_DN11346_c1_g2_i1:81-578(+)
MGALRDAAEGLVAGVALVAGACLFSWLTGNDSEHLEERTPSPGVSVGGGEGAGGEPGSIGAEAGGEVSEQASGGGDGVGEADGSGSNPSDVDGSDDPSSGEDCGSEAVSDDWVFSDSDSSDDSSVGYPDMYDPQPPPPSQPLLPPPPPPAWKAPPQKPQHLHGRH